MSLNNIEEKLDTFNLEVNTYEKILRTTLLWNIKNKHIQYQNINYETQRIKTRITEIISIRWNTAQEFKKSWIINRAQWLVRKYEELINSWINLEWDLIFLHWQLDLIKSKDASAKYTFRK